MTHKNTLSTFSAYLVLFVLMTFSVSAWANPAPINLGEAANFAVLSKVSISSVPTANITGDIGVSPAAATLITGIVCGEVIGTGVPFPTHVVSAGGDTIACQTVDPLYLTPTILEMEAAYTDANSRASDVTMDTDLGGETLTPGVYTTAVDLGITSDVTLACGGDTNGVFIFRVAGNLDLSSSTDVVLTGGCQPGNVFWAVAGTTTINGGIGTESTFSGTVLGGPATSEITVITNSTVNGRLLGQKGIALQKSTITKPITTADTVSPTVVITTVPTSPANSTAALRYTFQFNEDVTGFNATDITLNFAGAGAGAVNGANFTAIDNNTYTLTLNGTDLTDLGLLTTNQTVVASVDMTGLTDTATNAGVGTTTNTWVYDFTAPTVVITTVPTSPSNLTTALVYTFEFSENVTGFTAADITLNFADAGAGAVNGATFVAVDNNTYTLTFAGTDLTDLGLLTTNQTVIASVNMTGLTDNATNAGIGTTNTTWTYDPTAPAVTSFTLSDSDVTVGQTITGTCAATDNSGSVNTSITGISTTSAGTYTATCTATDAAGNTATATASYTVTAASSGGHRGGGGGGGAILWDCGAWSSCDAQGSRTKDCTQIGGTAVSTEQEACTPEETVPTPVVQPVQPTQPEQPPAQTPTTPVPPPVTTPAAPDTTGLVTGEDDVSSGTPLWLKVAGIVALVALIAGVVIAAMQKPKKK